MALDYLALYRSLAGGQAPADCRPFKDAHTLIRAIRVLGDNRATLVAGGGGLEAPKKSQYIYRAGCPYGVWRVPRRCPCDLIHIAQRRMWLLRPCSSLLPCGALV